MKTNKIFFGKGKQLQEACCCCPCGEQGVLGDLEETNLKEQ